MKKLAFLCDSSIALDPNEAIKKDIYIAPLTITHDHQSFADQIEISGEDVASLLRENKVVGTSQPNIGVIIEILEDIKAKDYDHLFILPVTTHLSGTYNAFRQALLEVEMDNVSLINTYTIAGPVQESIHLIRRMNEQNYTIDEIEDYLVETFFKQTESYLYPDNLDQLKAGGRISKAAATLASMLKVSILLKLENEGERIEKFAVSRTERKLFSQLIDDFKEHGVHPSTHKLYIPHLESEGKARVLLAALRKAYGQDFEAELIDLPAALAVHAGIGTLALQWCLDANHIFL